MSSPSAPPPPDDSPGVPGFRTWRGVYALVVAWFVLTAGLLAWLTYSCR